MLDSIPIPGPNPHFRAWEQIPLENPEAWKWLLRGEGGSESPSLSPGTTSASFPPAGSDSPCISSPGIYVIGFSYPVVPKGKARIRVQISAVHSDEDIDRCVEAFTEVGRKHGALP